ncbi:MAG: tetratricopeptide repeat protein [Acidobacteria bacterium]|nr:tetratricopeptide repeat protein [Acidobacteriota bacterium]
MRRILIGALFVSSLACAASAAAQVIPGTPAHAAGQAGWAALREGRNQDAAAAFARAIDAEPRDPSLHLGAGLAAFLLGQPTAARHALERALALAPGLTAASQLLADILYRGSDIEGALRVYEDALRYAPNDATLVARVEKLRREAELHSSYFASHGARFTVLFEGPADEVLAPRALEMLEAAYWRVSTALAVYPEPIITVILYTEEQFRDITRSPQWAAGQYDGRIRVPVRGALADARELERVLVHEFTHALVQSVAPRGVPVWLHEGLAVAFEPSGTEWADGQLARSPARLPFARLAGSFEKLSTGEARLAYAQSAAIVSALLERGGAAAVGAVLQDIARGDGFAVAFERHFFMRYDDFVASLDAPIDLLR